ncbi:MAG: metallophosphoesterase family protein [Silvanigrellaceae bacterium]
MSDAIRAYAFFTDVHGNMTALEAVLDDMREFSRQREVEHFQKVCLGDSFDGGPDPAAVHDRLVELGCPHLRGNHEDYLFQCAANPDEEKFTRPLWKFVPWTVQRMGDRLSRIKAISVDRWVAKDDPFVAVHGAVEGNNRVPDFFVQQSSLSSAFNSSHDEKSSGETTFFFNGHSHYLGRHEHKGNVWFNCGSVGYPFVEKLPNRSDAPLATWVWVEVEKNSRVKIFNRRVPYSSDELLRRYVDSGALEMCAPFSFAIAAQSLFNQDVVYPFFQSVKNRNLTPGEMAKLLVVELGKQDVFSRVNNLLQRAGLAEVKFH